ncbi:MAG: glycosyltransferase family 4 protein [Saprospiraceae bacterium]
MEKPIKVLVISNYDDNFNAVRPEGEIFIGLKKAGLEVEVMTYGSTPFAARFREAGIRVIDFHPQKKIDGVAIKLIRETLEAGQHDILHLFNNKAIINGIIAAWRLPVKVVTYRGYTGNIHWYDPTCYLTHLNPRVDKITCLADSVKELFQRQLFFKKEKAVTVNKGHRLAWYEGVEAADLSEFNLPPNAVTASIVANARKMKGIPYLMEATKHLPEDAPIHFFLIGRNMDVPEVRKILATSPYKDRVHFPGFRRDVLQLVKACDFSILPSIFGEATPKGALEAFFLGNPTIITSIPGNRGMAIDGETGLVVPPRDHIALAKAIEKLAFNPALRQEMGKKGQAHIASFLSVERSVSEMKKVYEGLLG